MLWCLGVQIPDRSPDIIYLFFQTDWSDSSKQFDLLLYYWSTDPFRGIRKWYSLPSLWNRWRYNFELSNIQAVHPFPMNKVITSWNITESIHWWATIFRPSPCRCNSFWQLTIFDCIYEKIYLILTMPNIIRNQLQRSFECIILISSFYQNRGIFLPPCKSSIAHVHQHNFLQSPLALDYHIF